MIKAPAVELGATDQDSKTEPGARPQASQTKIKGLLPTVTAPIAPPAKCEASDELRPTGHQSQLACKKTPVTKEPGKQQHQ